MFRAGKTLSWRRKAAGENHKNQGPRGLAPHGRDDKKFCRRGEKAGLPMVMD